jgi:hypothetical protein
LNPLAPSPAEAAGLRFLLPFPDLRRRFLLAGALFAAGLAAWGLLPRPLALGGLVLVLAGHLPLWARSQTTAPGGATPAHEDVWAPVEDEWLDRVEKLEARGERWDVTPFDPSNWTGFLTLAGVLLLLAILSFLVGTALGGDALVRVSLGSLFLLFPLWASGIRSTWNPSELRKKGEALAVARESVEALPGREFDLVPLLALREGSRGHYPVDARLMARPAREDASGFLGVQFQVAMNNVKGTDYPYLYAVILGKPAFRFPDGRGREDVHGGDLVFEAGESQDVHYRVVRQHADSRGGWHTQPEDIERIARVALERAREAWRANAGGSPA